MRRIIFFMLTSLDGYFEGIGRDISWHNVDEEFNEFAIEQLSTVDTLLFGRVTYEMMASYWPLPVAKTNDPVVAEKMNNTSKLVFSRTLEKADWHNTRLIKNTFVEEMQNLKKQSGQDMIILGSSNLAVTFMDHGLIDEFRVMVNPLVLGNGKSLFKGIQEKLDLKLIKTRTFKNGNVLLCYEPER